MKTRLIKWALLGGVAGAIAMALRSYQRNDDTEAVAGQSARAGAAGAAVGAAAAVVVNRRTRKNLSVLQRAGTALHLDDLNLDKLHLDDKREKIEKHAGRISHAAAPKLQSAFDLLIDAADLARPVVEAAASRGSEVASHTAGAASSKVRSVRKH